MDVYALSALLRMRVADLTFVPCVLVTRVLPIPRCENVLGAFTSYQSFLANGSTLHGGISSVRQKCVTKAL